MGLAHIQLENKGFQMRLHDVESNIWQALSLGVRPISPVGRGLHSSTSQLNLSRV